MYKYTPEIVIEASEKIREIKSRSREEYVEAIKEIKDKYNIDTLTLNNLLFTILEDEGRYNLIKIYNGLSENEKDFKILGKDASVTLFTSNFSELNNILDDKVVNIHEGLQNITRTNCLKSVLKDIKDNSIIEGEGNLDILQEMLWDIEYVPMLQSSGIVDNSIHYYFIGAWLSTELIIKIVIEL